MFRADALQIWPLETPLPAFSRVVLSLDTAYKVTASADYSVCLALGRAAACQYCP